MIWRCVIALVSIGMSLSLYAADFPYYWVTSEPVLRATNRATLSLQICDARRFAWEPVVLPSHPDLLAKLVSERAIETAQKGVTCSGTEWTWQIMPTRGGVIRLDRVVMRSNQFGRTVDIPLEGPALRVEGAPEWLPPWVASDPPQRFSWVESTSEEDLPIVQQSVVIRSSLSRQRIEEWLSLVLEDQPAWSALAPLIEPMPGGLGDEFKITLYAARRAPEVPLLWLQLKAFNPKSQRIETFVLERPPTPVLGEVHGVVGPGWIDRWAALYRMGLSLVPAVAAAALVLIAAIALLQTHGWRLRRRWLLFRLGRAQTPQQLWVILRSGPWPLSGAKQRTPLKWSQAASRCLGEASARKALEAAMTELNRCLYRQHSAQEPASLRDLRRLLIQTLKHPGWKHPGHHAAHEG